MKKEEARLTIEKKLNKTVHSDPMIHHACLLIHSDKYQIHWNMDSGKTDDMPAKAEQLYHTASIGKSFTAVIIAILVEEGRLNYHDPPQDKNTYMQKLDRH